MNGESEFYIGYLPKAPPQIGRIVRRIVMAASLFGVCTAVLLMLGQQPFAASTFEYGEYKPHDGVLEERPYPALVENGSRYLLVAPGKHGTADLVRGLGGRQTSLKGALIRRGQDVMVEILPGSVQTGASRAEPLETAPIPIGQVTWTGEIADSKCYFGVMNPGNGKVHRDCAVRCISGGIPPVFLVRDSSGMLRTVLLAGSDGRAIGRDVLDFVAEPVEIRGQLVRQGSAMVLQADRAQFRRMRE